MKSGDKYLQCMMDVDRITSLAMFYNTKEDAETIDQFYRKHPRQNSAVVPYHFSHVTENDVLMNDMVKWTIFIFI